VSPVKYELGFYIPEGDILHSHRRENLKSYVPVLMFLMSVSFPRTQLVISYCFLCQPTNAYNI
jgi:hypothetical protein